MNNCDHISWHDVSTHQLIIVIIVPVRILFWSLYHQTLPTENTSCLVPPHKWGFDLQGFHGRALRGFPAMLVKCMNMLPWIHLHYAHSMKAWLPPLMAQSINPRFSTLSTHHSLLDSFWQMHSKCLTSWPIGTYQLSWLTECSIRPHALTMA